MEKAWVLLLVAVVVVGGCLAYFSISDSDESTETKYSGEIQEEDSSGSVNLIVNNPEEGNEENDQQEG